MRRILYLLRDVIREVGDAVCAMYLARSSFVVFGTSGMEWIGVLMSKLGR